MSSVRRYAPTTPGRRGMSTQDFSDITKKTPEKKLVSGKKSTGGRNVNGRITARFRGGGHKRRYRQIDFYRNKTGIPAQVVAIEYDPNRSARIALLHYLDGEKAYILAPSDLKVGHEVIAANSADILPGNSLPLKYVPVGTRIHGVEIRPKGGAVLGRSAGTGITLMAKEGEWATLRLPSSEVRKVHINCRCVIGVIGNTEHLNVKWGKAGRTRWRGKRPHNRGVSMNPVDHPMGGGEGRSSGGRHPCTPWGIPTKGYHTRHNKRTDKMIVRRRKRK